MSFYSETDLPGIGKKINVTTHMNDKLSIIVHHDGKRELYIMGSDGSSNARATLLDEESRQLATFLSGKNYKPKSIESLEVALEGIEINWFKLRPTSPLIGHKLGGLGIRKKSQISIIAIVNESGFVPSPSSDYVFKDGDTCVVIGMPERFPDFLKIINGA